MQLWGSLCERLGELSTLRTRTLSSVLGVAWGTFGVVGILAFGRGLEDLMREKAEGLGQGVVVAWGQRSTRPFAGYPPGRSILLSEEDAVAVQVQLDELAVVSPEYVRGANLQRGERLFTVTVSGVQPQYSDLRNLTPMPGGRFLNQRDVEEQRAVVFIGDEVRRQLFGPADPLGGTIRIADTPFTVVGHMRPKLQDSSYEGLDEARVCIPTSTFQRVFGDRWIDYLVFAARTHGNSAQVTDRVYELLGRRLRFDPADRDALALMDMTEFDRIRETSFLAMDVLVGLACVFTLLVGGIGVGNLMFLAVRRRTREIGIRMALGARPRWILLEVLTEALVLVAAGGLAGFLAAWGLSAFISATPAAEFLGQPRISAGAAAATLALLGAIGLGAGWFPARRASRLDPARILAE